MPIDMRVMATTLVNKTVMSDKGEMLGTIENLIAETKNGNIESIIINPNEGLSKDFKLNKDGKLVIPFKNIKAIKDVIVVKG